MNWTPAHDGGFVASPAPPVDIPGCVVFCEVWQRRGAWQAGITVFIRGISVGMWATAVGDAAEGRAWVEENWQQRSLEVLQRFVFAGHPSRDPAAKGICGFAVMGLEDIVTLPDIFVSAEEAAFVRAHLSRRRLAEKARAMRWSGSWK